jgi:histone demethylase JARID1
MSPGSRDLHSQLQSTGKPSNFNNTGDTTPPSSPLSVASSPLSEPDDAERRGANGKTESRRTSRNGLHGEGLCRTLSMRMPILLNVYVSAASKSALSSVSAPVFHDKNDVRETSEVRPRLLRLISDIASVTLRQQQTCEICHKTNNDDKMLLCDGCDCGK